MKTILHVASSSNVKGSVSRQIGAKTVARLKAANPGSSVIERDLVTRPLPHLSPEVVAVFYTHGSPELALSDQLVDEVLAADTLVIEAPMYNFSIPSALKAWIDHIARAGRTFAYGEGGPKGLLSGKKAILVLSRGGVYSSGPAQSMDFQENYLRFILGFIGITDVETVYIEGMGKGPDKVAEAVAKAEERVAQLAA